MSVTLRSLEPGQLGIWASGVLVCCSTRATFPLTLSQPVMRHCLAGLSYHLLRAIILCPGGFTITGVLCWGPLG